MCPICEKEDCFCPVNIWNEKIRVGVTGEQVFTKEKASSLFGTRSVMGTFECLVGDYNEMHEKIYIKDKIETSFKIVKQIKPNCFFDLLDDFETYQKVLYEDGNDWITFYFESNDVMARINIKYKEGRTIDGFEAYFPKIKYSFIQKIDNKKGFTAENITIYEGKEAVKGAYILKNERDHWWAK